jgi:hypothetical protein
MKSWPDKLRETPIDNLTRMIAKQKSEIKIKQRDLETMEKILKEKIS